jgi:hypothetical protein
MSGPVSRLLSASQALDEGLYMAEIGYVGERDQPGLKTAFARSFGVRDKI